MIREKFIKEVVRWLIVFISSIVLMRYTAGYFGIVLCLTGVFAAISHKNDIALACYCMLPFYVIINPMLIPELVGYGAVERISFALIGGGLLISAFSNGSRARIPILSLGLYLFCAVISSMNGYAPIISYLKIANFALFVGGLYIGTAGFDRNENWNFRLRGFFMAFSIFIVIGSVCTLAFPSVAYYISLKGAFAEGGINYALAQYQNVQNEGTGLLCGVTGHSQCLATMVAICGGWVACDMIFVERRLTKLHLSILILWPLISYMTRSRISLVLLVVAWAFVILYCLPKAKGDRGMGRRLKALVGVGLIALIAMACAVEISSGSMTRWLRKTSIENVHKDDRSLTEAFTESRMGLIEESLLDFKKNPIMGMGFQVTEMIDILYQAGRVSIFSAPIEKGFLPTMILGECGVVGLMAFIVFLISFYRACSRNKYHATTVMFTLLLTCNIAEATFFSPGGGGGAIWVMCTVGGFVIDMICLNRMKAELSARLNFYR